MMENTLREMTNKLKEALESSQYSKLNLLPISIFFVVVMLGSFLFFVVPHAPKEKSKQVTVERVTFPAVYPKPEVQAHNFLLPAYGTVAVDRLDACKTDSRKNLKSITAEMRAGTVLFKSYESEPVLIRVWFYDQGNHSSCRKAYDQLEKRGLIN